MGLENKSKAVQVKTTLFEEYRLQILLRKKIIDGIKITDNDSKEKFKEMIVGNRIEASVDNYQDVIERNILMERKATEVPNFIRKLREGLTIQTQVQLIHDNYDSIAKK